MLYPINEIFESIQGEGSYTGAPSVFVRLQGCPVGCAWCDTRHSWDLLPEKKTDLATVLAKTGDSDLWCEVDQQQLLAQLTTYHAKHIIFTGGEPCMFDLTSLTELLEANGCTTQIETSGTFEIKTSPKTWVTVSPKVNMKGGYAILDSTLVRADEIKHPVAMSRHVEELDNLLSVLSPAQLAEKMIYLQPISQQKRATQFAIDTCIKRNWRLSIQTHKYLGIL